MNKDEYNLDNLDEQTDRNSLKYLLITIAVFCFVVILNELNIFILNSQVVMRCFWIVLPLTTIITIICYANKFSKPWLKYCILLFLVIIMTIIGMSLTYHTVLLSLLPLLYASMYQDKKVAYITFIMMMLSTLVVVYGGYYYGICDANMALLTVDPLASYVTEDGHFLYSMVNENPTLSLALYYVVPRCLIFTIFIPVSNTISKNLRDMVTLSNKLKIYSETDEMTGLFNKNKYRSVCEQGFPANCKIGIIFWDINMLKFVNDTHGHKQGDLLIQTVAGSVRLFSDATHQCYRVGGDEMVMIITDADEENILKLIDRWEKYLKTLDEVTEFPVSVAVGYAFGMGNQLAQVIDQADSNMYIDKNKKSIHR